MVWVATSALAGAANETRWHAGGYLTRSLALAWHVLVFAMLTGHRGAAEGAEAVWAPAFRLAVDLSVLIAILVIFGYNAVQGAIVLALRWQLFDEDQHQQTVHAAMVGLLLAVPVAATARPSA